jgi:hypothetical protein
MSRTMERLSRAEFDALVACRIPEWGAPRVRLLPPEGSHAAQLLRGCRVDIVYGGRRALAYVPPTLAVVGIAVEDCHGTQWSVRKVLGWAHEDNCPGMLVCRLAPIKRSRDDDG